ncbi:MAG: hypothetical protein J6T70_01335 [Bacteroidales bacterium]|nr:hypothetical protein [Bacteroidales bacterium]
MANRITKKEKNLTLRVNFSRAREEGESQSICFPTESNYPFVIAVAQNYNIAMCKHNSCNGQ